MKMQYRITGRFRKSDKRHVVDSDPNWTESRAKARLRELQLQSQREMETKSRKVMVSGMIGISTEYYSDYDLLDLRLESREVSPWSEIK